LRLRNNFLMGNRRQILLTKRLNNPSRTLTLELIE
jgi:hypothetical protein